MKRQLLLFAWLLFMLGCATKKHNTQVPMVAGTRVRFVGVHADNTCSVTHATLDAKTGVYEIYCKQ